MCVLRSLLRVVLAFWITCGESGGQGPKRSLREGSASSASSLALAHAGARSRPRSEPPCSPLGASETRVIFYASRARDSA